MSYNWPSSPGSLFWPSEACLLPHNDNNNDDINNSTDNNHLQRILFWPPDARLLPHPAASVQTEHLLARGSKVSNHKNILGINLTHGFEMNWIESSFNSTLITDMASTAAWSTDLLSIFGWQRSPKRFLEQLPSTCSSKLSLIRLADFHAVFF